MGKSSREVYGADGSTNLLSFAPEKLTIVTDPASPLYDERITLPLDEAMIRNIQTFGVLEPIIVTRDTDTGDVLVIDGRQRVRHALEANKRLDAAGLPLLLVPATTRKGDDDAALMSIMVATNEIRQADPPMVRAAKMQRMKARGMDDAGVALAFGCSTQTVAATLCLLDCAKVTQKAVEQGLIGITDAKYLSRLTPAQQTAKVAELIHNVAGKEGHARARAKREVLATQAAPGDKPVAPKTRGRKEILAKIEELRSEQCDMTAVQLLEWVLGADLGGSSEDQVDTKTAPLLEEAAQ